jgi:uncharacterized membrane protein YgdD (TMEM256/DUF423 family)
MHKRFLLLASIFGAFAVALGAFGAHGLKKIVQPGDLSTFQTGVQYQMYHAFALLAAGILYEKFHNKWIWWAGVCFIIGIFLFSGSLYILTFLKANAAVGTAGVGLITPFGGLFFIMGWIFLFVGISSRL